MTCIVGIVFDNRVYMGADSYGSNGYSGGTVLNPKCFISGEFIIGCTSTFRLIDVLRYKLVIPKIHPDDQADADKYMRTTFIDAVRKCLTENGHLSKNTDGLESGGNFLVGYKNGLYEVQSDFSVLTVPIWGHSVGSGENSARGSLYTTKDMQLTPEQRITTALESASSTVPSVRPPFVIITL